MEQTRTVLVVDDDPDVLESVISYLSQREFRIVTASRWTEAIAQIQDASPDVVLLDQHLPTVRGEALLEFIRELDRTLPVVIITSAIATEEMERLGDLGASGFIRKPFETDDLLVVLEQVLIEWGPSPPEPVATPDSGNGSQTLQASPASAETDSVQVSPGAGVGALEPQGRSSSRRRRTGSSTRRRRAGRRFRQIRNYFLMLILCVFIGVIFWMFQDTFSKGFMGIGVAPAAKEEAE